MGVLVNISFLTFLLSRSITKGGDLPEVNPFTDILLSPQKSYENFGSYNIALMANFSIPLISNPSILTLTIGRLEELQFHLNQVVEMLQSEKVFWKPRIFLRLPLENSTGGLKGGGTDEDLNKILIQSSEFLRLDSEVFFIVGNEAYEMYRVKGRIWVNPVFLEFDDYGIVVRESMIERRGDFDKILIKGVTQDDKTLDLIARFESDGNGGAKFIGGVSVAYFQLMADGLNFMVGAVRGEGWISQAPNGTLLGMAQQLLNGEADILIAFSEFLPYRLKGLGFIHPYYNALVRAFFRQPPANQIRNIFTQPYQPKLWIALSVLWALIGISLKMAYLAKVWNSKVKPKGICWSKDELIGKDSLLWSIASACGQGWWMLPKSGTMKLIMLSGLITYMFSYTAYSAAIVTSLSLTLAPIKSWEELLAADYEMFGDTMVVSSGALSSKYSRRSLVPNKETVLEVREALKRFSSDKRIALISVQDQFYQIASKEEGYEEDFLCSKVSQVRVQGASVKGGMIIKDSTFKDFFNYLTIKIQERGLDSRLSYHYRADYTPKCPPKALTTLGSYTLGMNDVFSAFLILAFAIVSSGLILLWERGRFKRNSKNNCII